MNRIELLKERERLHKLEYDLYRLPNDFYLFNFDRYINNPNSLYFSLSEDCYCCLYDIVDTLKLYNLPYDKLKGLLKKASKICYDNDLFDFDDTNADIFIEKLSSVHNEIIEEMKYLDSIIDKDREEIDRKKYDELMDYADLKYEVWKKELDNINMQIEKYEDLYLEKMTEIASEYMRKRCQNTKDHWNWLFKNVVIRWDRYNELDYNIGGRYDSEYKLILINNRFLNCDNKLDHRNYRRKQKDINKDLFGVLVHELTHHLVDNTYSERLDPHSDYSPIFMATLLFINPNEKNAYPQFEDFKETQTYRETKKCKNYMELQNLCRKLQYDTYDIYSRCRTKDGCFWTTPDSCCYEYNEINEELNKRYEQAYNRKVKFKSIGIDWYRFVEENKIRVQ